ncbi:MAG: hypothetical protein V7739_16350, partial [Motiliproteus sp.]
RTVPIAFKLKVTANPEDMLPILQLIRGMQFDGVIAAEDGGKSAQRLSSKDSPQRQQLQQQICERIGYMKQQLGDQVDLISVGAIADVAEAHMRLQAGASLVQVHNALVYRGPWFFKELRSEALNCCP